MLMNSKKDVLNRQTERYFALRTLKNGVTRAFSSVRNALLFLAVLLVVILGLHCWICVSPDYLQKYLVTMLTILFPMIGLLCLYVWGYVPKSREYNNNLIRVGFVNAAGEAPVLIRDSQDEKKHELFFFSKGLLPIDWRDNIESIQSALNLTIGRIRQGSDYRTVIITVVPPNMTFGQTIMWDSQGVDTNHPTRFLLGKTAANETIEFDIEKTPMWLIGGSTGSGKTRLSIIILLQAILRDYRVYICDFKGLDFFPLVRRDATLLTDMNSIISVLAELEELIASRGKAFTKVEAKNYSDYIAKTKDPYCKRVMLLVDEMSMLTDYGRSKEAKQMSDTVIDKLAAIARVGRAYGIYLIVSTQRPDANAVPGPIKSNLDGRICGKADQTLSTIILGNGDAHNKIPKDAQGRFIISNGISEEVFQAYYFDED